MSNTEHKLPKLVINKALHMSTPEQCANTEAAVTAHVAQDSRTAHEVSDLYSVKSIVHELYFADDSVTRDDALVLIIRHIKNLLAKYE